KAVGLDPPSLVSVAIRTWPFRPARVSSQRLATRAVETGARQQVRGGLARQVPHLPPPRAPQRATQLLEMTPHEAAQGPRADRTKFRACARLHERGQPLIAPCQQILQQGAEALDLIAEMRNQRFERTRGFAALAEVLEQALA